MGKSQPGIRVGTRAFAIGGLTALLVSCAQPNAAGARTIVEDFESASSFGQWTFSNGAEFPGATGAFQRSEGRHGRGGSLNFAFTCVTPESCGAYVGAELELDSPLRPAPHSVLSFQALPYPHADIAIRLRDESGQTLQYPIAATTIEQQASSGWRRLSLPLDRFADEHWGGANNGRLSGGIISISVLARGGGPMRGALGLDDIQITDVAEQTYGLDTNLGPDPTTLPVDAPEIGVNVANFENPEALGAAREAGVSVVRADLTWNAVERDGRFVFANADVWLEHLAQRGLRALWILDYGHDDHGGGGAVRSEADRAAFQRYVSASAAHFRGHGVSYEVWNEPDVEGDRYYEPADFGELVRDAAAAVRAADPRAPIVTGGLSWGDYGYFAAMFGALGNAAPVSAIGFHPYRGGAPENAAGDFGQINAMIAQALPPATPIWVTEWGYSAAEGSADERAAATRAQQGIQLARQMLTAWAVHAPLAVWYELRDRGEEARSSEQSFGLLDFGGQPKPALDALRTFTQAAARRRLTGVLQDMPEAAHGLRLEGEHDTMFVLWTEAPDGRLVINTPQSALIEARDVFGATLPIARAVAQASFTLTGSEGPIYLRVSR